MSMTMNNGITPQSIPSSSSQLGSYGVSGVPSQQGSGDVANAGFPDLEGGDSSASGLVDDGGAARSGRTCHYTQHQPIAEFLYQLTKMLTDDNDEVIEWDQGRIKVHHPERLEGEILHKYFRHSKFSSFQRQLNYFGFRKIAGKGKMSPCSYVNDAATSDIRSLLLIKRKTNGSAARKAAMAQRAAIASTGAVPTDIMTSQPASNPQYQQQINTGYPFGAPAQAAAAAAAVAAASLFPQSALRVANLGQLAQLQQLKPPNESNFLTAEKALALLLAGQAQQQQLGDLSALNGFKAAIPSLEQLNAQLLSLATRQQNVHSNSAGNSTALSIPNMAAAAPASFAATAALNSLTSHAADQTPASAAAAAAASSASMPATAAMNAAVAAAGQISNLFDTPNLKSLVNEAPAGSGAQGQQVGGGLGGGNGGMASSRNLLGTRLPSSNTIFPDQSTASFGNLLTSSNRLSSLLSLGSFLSRDPSLADMLMLQQQQQQPNNGSNAAAAANNQLAAAAAAAASAGGPASAAAAAANSAMAGFEFARALQEGKSPF